MSTQKFAIQDAQYIEPYHHFVSLSETDPRHYAELSWGLEYYGYVTRVLELAAQKPAMRVAEVGCGDGNILLEFAKQHPDVTCEGFDISEKAIAFAKAYAFGTPHLNFFAKDFSTSSGSYDLILCIETLEHIPDTQVAEFLKTMRGKLAPGGSIIMTVPSTNRPLQAKHYRHYDVTLLHAHIAPFFTLQTYDFVHNNSAFGCILIRFLLANKLFILRVRKIRRILFAFYFKHYRIATEQSGTHLLAVLTPANE